MWPEKHRLVIKGNPNSDTNRIRSALIDRGGEVPPYLILGKIAGGLTTTQTAHKVKYLYNKGELDPSTRQDPTSRRRISASLVYGGPGLNLEEYGIMGMGPTESRWAVLIEKQTDYTKEHIGEIFHNARIKGRLQRLTPEEVDSVKKAGFMKDSQIIDRDRRWLGLRDVVKDLGFNPGLLRRLQWLEAIDLHTKLDNEVVLVDRNGVVSYINSLQERRYQVYSLTQQILDRRNIQPLESTIDPKLMKIIKGAKLDLLPASLTDWALLTEILELREEVRRGRPEKYNKFLRERIDGIPDYLDPCIKAITDYVASLPNW